MVGSVLLLQGATAVNMAFTLLLQVWLFRQFGRAEFGRYSFIIGAYMVFNLLFSWHLEITGIRFGAAAREQGPDAFRRTMSCCLCLHLALTLVGLVASYGIHLGGLSIRGVVIGPYFCAMALGTVFAGFVSYATAAMSVRSQFARLGVFQIATSIINAGVIAAVVWRWPTPFAALAARSAALLGCAALGVVMVWPSFHLTAVDWSGVVEVMRYGIQMCLTSVFKELFLRSDVLLLGYLSAPDPTVAFEIVGVYRIAATVTQPFMRLSTPVWHVLMPRISRAAARGDGPGLWRIYRDWRRLVGVALVGGACVGLFVVGPGLRLVFPKAAAEALPVAKVLLLGVAVGLLASVPSTVLRVLSVQTITVMSILNAVVNVVCNCALIPSFGAVGAAAASLLAISMSTIVLYVRASRAVQPAIRVGLPALERGLLLAGGLALLTCFWPGLWLLSPLPLAGFGVLGYWACAPVHSPAVAADEGPE